MKKFCLLLMLPLLVLLGCFNTRTYKYAKIDEKLCKKYLTRIYNAPVEKCFKATLAALKTLGFDVKTINKEKGIIITDRATIGTDVVVTRYRATSYDFKHQYYFRITSLGEKTKVHAFRYKAWRNDRMQKAVIPSWANNKFWKPLFNTIKSELEDLKYSS